MVLSSVRVVVVLVTLAVLVVVVSIGLCILVGSGGVKLEEAFVTPSAVVVAVSARGVVIPVIGMVLANVLLVGS